MKKPTLGHVNLVVGWIAIVVGASLLHPGAGLVAAGYLLVVFQNVLDRRKVIAPESNNVAERPHKRRTKRGVTH